jgi:hypothetical protein
MRFLGLNVGQRSIAAAVLPSLAWVSLASEASAQELVVDPRPSIDVSVAPPPPPVPRTFQVHEGFYLRAALGVGVLGSDLSYDVGDDLTTGGIQLEADLLIGGGLAPGMTLGGGVNYSVQLSGDWELDDSDVTVSDGDLSTFIIGPFVDGYPIAKDGWHFGGLAGLAIASFDPGPTADNSTAYGFGGSFWAGHDVWVAPEWSVGGLIKVSALSATDDDINATKLAISLMFTAVLN